MFVCMYVRLLVCYARCLRLTIFLPFLLIVAACVSVWLFVYLEAKSSRHCKGIASNRLWNWKRDDENGDDNDDIFN